MSTDAELAEIGFVRVEALPAGSVYAGLREYPWGTERWIVTTRKTIVSLDTGDEHDIGHTMISNQIDRQGARTQ